MGQLSQIALAIVAIFGYFYTVRPIYQKDRLEEQVAEYEGIIKKQVPKVVELEQQLVNLSLEREQLNSELKNIEHSLASARVEKKKIEDQVQFMTFKYRLPDGSPAVTNEQVQRAQDFEFSKSFKSGLSRSCPERNEFTLDFDSKGTEKTASFPFLEQELKDWAEHGMRLPLVRALSCATTYGGELIDQYTSDPRLVQLIATLKVDALRNINAAGTKPWVPPFEPSDIVKELASKRATVQMELEQEYRKIEDEYGGWESIWEEARRVIAKDNYEVGRLNAKNKARSALLSLDLEYGEKANALRKGINDEISRLIETARKTQ